MHSTQRGDDEEFSESLGGAFNGATYLQIGAQDVAPIIDARISVSHTRGS